MEENITKLMEIIEQESEALGILADTIYRQKEAIIKGDLPLLNKTTDLQNRALTRLNELDKMRVELSVPIANELGVQPEKVTISLLQKYFTGKLDARQNSLLASIRPLTDSIKRSTKMNTKIIKRCFQLGEDRLKKILQLRTNTGLYANSGKKARIRSGNSVMLNKQA
jgi:hypothetical protein